MAGDEHVWLEQLGERIVTGTCRSGIPCTVYEAIARLVLPTRFITPMSCGVIGPPLSSHMKR